jgi:hypothetical protein
MTLFHFSLWLNNIPWDIYIYFFLYPFIICWATLLFLYFHYCEESYNRQGYADISLVYCLLSFRCMPMSGMVGS